VRREHPGVGGQRGQTPQGPELGPGRSIGLLRPQEVGSAGPADHEASPREHGGRLLHAVLEHEVREVLRRVPGRLHGHQPDAAEPHLVAFAQRPVIERVPTPCRRADLSPGGVANLHRARHVVVVHVRLQHEPDGHVPAGGSGQEPARVPLRIDQRRFTARADEIRGVAEPAGHDQVEVHDTSPAAG